MEFDKIFLKCFRHELNDFCIQYGEEIGRLAVECDSDMKHSIKRWNFEKISEGRAYELSDAIAWCYSHDKKINGCSRIDLAGEIYAKLLAKMIK